LEPNRSAHAPQFAALLLSCVFLVSACDYSPTKPWGGLRYSPPSGIAVPPYTQPVWLTNGEHVGFNHWPLDTILYNSRTGDVSYRSVDSLSGWWVADQYGGNLRRYFRATLGVPALSRDGNSLVFTLPDLRLAILAMRSALPDSNPTVLDAYGIGGRWNAGGDSLVYNFPLSRDVWIVSRSGTGAHQVCSGLGTPDWHPSQRKILGTLTDFVGGSDTSRIVCYDLNSGTPTTILQSATVEYRWARYSPDGARIAWEQFPIQGGASHLELWIADSTGSNAHQLGHDPVDEFFDWNPSGTEIAYVRYDTGDFSRSNGTVWAVSVASGQTRQLASNARPLSSQADPSTPNLGSYRLLTIDRQPVDPSATLPSSR